MVSLRSTHGRYYKDIILYTNTHYTGFQQGGANRAEYDGTQLSEKVRRRAPVFCISAPYRLTISNSALALSRLLDDSKDVIVVTINYRLGALGFLVR